MVVIDNGELHYLSHDNYNHVLYMKSSIRATEAIDHLLQIADGAQGQSLLTQLAVSCISVWKRPVASLLHCQLHCCHVHIAITMYLQTARLLSLVRLAIAQKKLYV